MAVAYTDRNGDLTSIHRVKEAMQGRLADFERRGDHRAVFQRVYLLMITEMQTRLAASFFSDAAWMERVLCGFARYYFNILDAYDAGRDCPPAWRVALETAAARNAFVMQDALLGINAHINNDLAMVLNDILQEDRAWPDARIMLRRRRDYDRINNVLATLIDVVQDELARHYARFVRTIDRAMGRKDETMAAMILGHCHMNVWHYTELLLDASSEAERRQVQGEVEQQAHALALHVRDVRLFRLTRRLAPLARRWRLF